MSELCLSIVECRYPDDVQDQLLKDQYIYSVYVLRRYRTTSVEK